MTQKTHVTETEAKDALRELDILRGELRDDARFRDELEILYLGGMRCYSPRVEIPRGDRGPVSIDMPYEMVMKYTMEKLKETEKAIKELESLFKSEQS